MGLLDELLPAVAVEKQIHNIRRAMLRILSTCDSDAEKKRVIFDKIQYATSIQTLWYLRNDLASLLSASCGKKMDCEQMSKVTAMFQGLLPKSGPVQ
jgi:hypothetical protein